MINQTTFEYELIDLNSVKNSQEPNDILFRMMNSNLCPEDVRRIVYNAYTE